MRTRLCWSYSRYGKLLIHAGVQTGLDFDVHVVDCKCFKTAMNMNAARSSHPSLTLILLVLTVVLMLAVIARSLLL